MRLLSEMTDADAPREFHVQVAAADVDAVSLLEQASGLSRGRVKAAMSKGAVWITRGRRTQRLRRTKRKLHAGDELHLYYDPKVLDEAPTPPTLIADAGDYSVWNKPCERKP